MPNFTTSKRLFEMLLLPLVALLAKAVPSHNTDSRCHKFNTQHHFYLAIFAQLTKAESSIALLEELNDTECTNQQRNLRQLIGFNALKFGQGVTLNQSSFSRANANRSYRVWRYCFHKLLATARKHCAKPQLKGLERVLSIDGSLFDCLDSLVWASYASTTNKVKGHFFFDLDGLPDKMVLTTGKASEGEILATHFRAGFTYLFDRGYKDYTLFKDFVTAKAHFVTRLMSNANYKVVQRRPISTEQAGLGVIADELIKLGRHNSTALSKVRLVTFKDTQGKLWRYITSREDLEPVIIVELT